MQKFRADLHIHTVLSPCADLEMTPQKIVNRAQEVKLDIIGITDHNSTRQVKLVKQLAKNTNLFVLGGAEITTKEEVHCLVFFEQEAQLDKLQLFIDKHLTKIPNPDGHFGYQPVLDVQENILEMIPYYLPAALNVGINELQIVVKQMGGLFIPAHIDRPSNGIFSQLGFIPENLEFDGLGISRLSSEKYVRKHYFLEKKNPLIRNSDAHFLDQIGETFSYFNMAKINFSEIKMALNQQDNRFIEIDENNI